MKLRRSFLFFVWLCLTLGFSFLEAYTEKDALENHKDEKQTQQTKKKKEKHHVILPPPTIYQYEPLSKTRRLLRKIRMGPSRLLKSKTTHEKTVLQNQSMDDHYNPRLGFEMAVLSGLSYWEFHKKDPPENTTGFAILKFIPSVSKFRKKIRKFRAKFRYYRNKLKDRCSLMIRESFPIARSLKRRKSRNATEFDGPGVNITRGNNNKNPFYTLEYSFYNWHEPTNIKGVSFHDTDVLISTANNGNTLVIAFAGSASPADVVTNVQTFEPANHSLFFEPRSNRPKDPQFWKNNAKNHSNDKNTTQTQGSLHRGFLNAYSRVERGNVMRIQTTDTLHPRIENTTTTSHLLPNSMRWWRGPIKERHRNEGETKQRKPTKPPILDSLNRRFGHCHSNAAATLEDEKEHVGEDNDNNIDDASEDDDDLENLKMTNESGEKPDRKKKKRKKKRYGGCKVMEKAGGEPPIGLSVVLKELVETALANGYKVHITGHSLGGALATLLVLDVLVNENIVEFDMHNNAHNNMYLWTFGAPQIADLLFWESLLVHSPKLRRFLMGNDIAEKTITVNRSTSRQFVHRYVTLGDDGKVDAVSEVAKNTLAAHKESSSSDTKDTNQSERAAQEKNITSDNDPSLARNEHNGKKKWPDAIHGKFAQSLGGVSSGSEVTHFIEAHYLWTPDQQQKQLERNQQEQMKQLKELENHLLGEQEKDGGEEAIADSVTDTRSSMHAHSIRNYLMGISREAGPDQHPLIPDLPLEWLEYLEIVPKK